MLKIYKLVGEEIIVAEFVRETSSSIFVKNPLVPKMRSVIVKGKPCVTLSWVPFVQFTCNLLETMKSINLPTNLLMWSDTPAEEVADSYRVAIETIENRVEGKRVEESICNSDLNKST